MRKKTLRISENFWPHGFVQKLPKKFVLQASPGNAPAASIEPSRPRNPMRMSNQPRVTALPGNTLHRWRRPMEPWTPANPADGSQPRFPALRFADGSCGGGFGTVYRADDPLLDREVALKVPHPSRLKSEHDKTRVLEAKAAAQLRHPNIVPVYDAGTDGDQFLLPRRLSRGRRWPIA